jgi:hypothetical protein
MTRRLRGVSLGSLNQKLDLPWRVTQEGKDRGDQAFALDHGIPDGIQFIVAHYARSATAWQNGTQRTLLQVQQTLSLFTGVLKVLESSPTRNRRLQNRILRSR